MTRINLVHPTNLTDKHLSGERFEIIRVVTNLEKLAEKGERINEYKIPARYVLGTGHVYFFYNKISFIKARYTGLTSEATFRDVNINGIEFEKNISRMRNIIKHFRDQQIYYTPTPEEIYLSMSRLVESHFGVTDTKEMDANYRSAM